MNARLLAVVVAALASVASGSVSAQANPFQKDSLNGNATLQQPAGQTASPWVRGSAVTKPAGAADAAGNKRDSLSDLSQEQALKLQMNMDRQQKAAQALSNIQKKNADTSSAITGNIK
ncbi:hypothetical protein BH09PSE6_BH09PSE6_03300 [soil metagenome]